MRLDDMPESGNVEDRRGDGGGFGGGMGGLPIGTGGLGIGGMVVLGLIGWALGIDPWLLINGANVVIGDRAVTSSRSARQQDTRAAPAPPATTPENSSRASSAAPRWVEGYLRQGRPDLSCAQARHVLGPDALGLRRGAERDGAVLLPERSRGLSRHLVLQRSRDGASAAAPARPASSPRPM